MKSCKSVRDWICSRGGSGAHLKASPWLVVHTLKLKVVKEDILRPPSVFACDFSVGRVVCRVVMLDNCILNTLQQT